MLLNDRKILVTGLTGKLGGSIAEHLVKENEVWGLARYSRSGELEKWQAAGVRCVVGDYADGQFAGLPDDFDYVIHSAANTRPDSYAQGMRDNAWGVGKLMGFCHKTKAFLHVSATAVYARHPDPHHLYREDDVTGSGMMGHYGGTKLAGEGAAMAMSAYLGLPLSICRLNVQYGIYNGGGLFGMYLAALLKGETILLPAGETQISSPVANEDIVRFLPGCLAAASVPGTVINWGGDEPVNNIEVIEYMASLLKIEPKYEISSKGYQYMTMTLDPSFRQSVAGKGEVAWRDGVRTMVEALAPQFRHRS